MSEGQKSAARQKPVTFEFDGERYTVDPANVTLDVMEAAEENRLITAVKLLLGEEQYLRYKAKHPQVADLEGFFQQMWDAIGVGNSAASPRS